MIPSRHLPMALFAGLLLACNSTTPSRPGTTAAAPSAPSTDSSSAAASTAAPSQSATAAATATAVDPASIVRLEPTEAHALVAAGKALLVCAYGDRSKCAGLGIEKGISWTDLTEKLPELEKDQQIILYCA